MLWDDKRIDQELRFLAAYIDQKNLSMDMADLFGFLRILLKMRDEYEKALADRSASLDEACSVALSDMPIDYHIAIWLEKGFGEVDLVNSNTSDVVPITKSDSALSEQLELCIRKAKKLVEDES